jgi:hypothetical protein
MSSPTPTLSLHSVLPSYPAGPPPPYVADDYDPQVIAANFPPAVEDEGAADTPPPYPRRLCHTFVLFTFPSYFSHAYTAVVTGPGSLFP